MPVVALGEGIVPLYAVAFGLRIHRKVRDDAARAHVQKPGQFTAAWRMQLVAHHHVAAQILSHQRLLQRNDAHCLSFWRSGAGAFHKMEWMRLKVRRHEARLNSPAREYGEFALCGSPSQWLQFVLVCGFAVCGESEFLYIWDAIFLEDFHCLVRRGMVSVKCLAYFMLQQPFRIAHEAADIYAGEKI